MPHERFRLRALDDLSAKAQELGLDLPIDTDLAPLAQKVRIGASETPNALAVQPMEGCDATPGGAPDALTVRRYLRFAGGGAGLLWFEATAVLPEARANPRQLLLVPETATGRTTGATQTRGMRNSTSSVIRSGGHLSRTKSHT